MQPTPIIIAVCAKQKNATCIYNPSTSEAEVGESGVQSQPGLHRRTLLEKKKIKDLAEYLPSMGKALGLNPIIGEREKKMQQCREPL